MKDSYDIIIVGAGPAGSAASIILANKGFKVAIIEKKNLPRHKHCGGCISSRSISSLQKLGINIESVSLHKYKGFTMRYGDLVTGYDWGDMKVYGVYREVFDYAITNKAIDAGVVILKNQVKKLRMEDDIIFVFLDNDNILETKVLFGADGIHSIIRKEIGVTYQKNKLGFCLETEVPATDEIIDSYNDRLSLDFSYFKEGYIWAFPKKLGKTINIGFGTDFHTVKNSKIPIKEILQRYAQDKGLSLPRIHGAFIPFGGTVDCFGRNTVILLGDAAGLVSPLSGEGISYALESGIYAAESAIDFFEHNTPLLESYSRKLNSIKNEINIYGLQLQKKMYRGRTHRKLMFKMCSKNQDIMKKLGEIFTQKITYEQGVKQLTPLKLLPAMVKALVT